MDRSQKEKATINFCPTMTNAQDTLDCDYECAWFDEDCGQCAILTIATALTKIATKGILNKREL